MKKTFIILVCLLFLFAAPAAADGEHGLGHYDIDVTIPSVQSTASSSAYTGHVYAANLPAAYDLRDRGVVTPVKEQGKYGSCWSFSVINALESNAIMQGFETAETADFSELQLLYFYYNRDGVTVGDVLPEFSGLADDNVEILTGESYLDAGGNIIFAGRHLSKGMGVIDETYAPYSLTNSQDWDNTTVPPVLDARLAIDKNRYLVSNVTLLTPSDRDLVKEYLMEYGCGAICYYDADEYFNTAEYQGQQSTSYFQNVQESTNHAVSLVGWDDNYPKENFLIQPKNNGAWLIKNSWGEDFGDDGYFWISYEDTSTSVAVFYELRPSAEYDSIYQYDGSLSNGGIYSIEPIIEDDVSVASSMNVYTASGDELITHVSFETFNTHVSYAVLVTNETEDFMYVQEGELVSPGYYTVELTTPVSVREGETFAVAVAFAAPATSENIIDGTSTLMLPVDQNYSDEDLFFTSVSRPEESWWFDGSDYFDAYDLQSDVIGQYNFRIKAFAVDAESLVTPPVQGEITLSSISAAGDYIGSDVMLSGTAEPNTALYFYVKDTSGKVAFRQLAVDGAAVSVLTDSSGTWSVTIPGAAFYEEAGVIASGIEYQIYAAYVSSVESLDALVSSSSSYVCSDILTLNVPYLVCSSADDSIEPGSSVVVDGYAYGAESIVYYLFSDYDVIFDKVPVASDGYFTVTLPTDSLPDGQYWLIIQHPMYDSRFNINPVSNYPSGSLDFVLDWPAGNLTTPGHLFTLPDGSGQKAVDLLLDAFSELDSMDLGLCMEFFIGDLVFTISPIDTVTQGSLLTIDGTTTAPVGTNLTYATGISSDGYLITETDLGYTEVKMGTAGANVWSVSLDTTAYQAGEYIFGIVLTEDDSVGTVSYFTVEASAPTPEKPAAPTLTPPESLPEDATVTTNTVAETNAATKAEVGYQVKPTEVTKLTAPTITRGKLSVQLNEGVKVVKTLADGNTVEVEATVNEDGSINLPSGALDDAATVTVNFIGRQFGDVTNDGKPDTLDAARVLQASVGLFDFSGADTFYGDVSGDGFANTLDAARILQYSVSLVDENYVTKA